jgi:hypothetical protein
MSGGGGQTTGSQSGGSAQGGNSHAPMDIGASVQASLMMAQAMKLKAETKEIEAKTDKVGQDISESQQRVMESISKVELNEKLGITEDSKAKLNGIVGKLQEEATKKAISDTELNNADLEWMKENGINRNDSVITKTIKYFSDETGLKPKEIIWILGGLKAVDSLG